VRLRALSVLLCATLLTAGEGPFDAPPELKAFAQKHTWTQVSARSKVGALVRAFFASPAEGGLGLTYDNAFTRTPREVWRDRKANCFSLTALYVDACKSIGLDAQFGESLRISHWRRVGQMIRYERHIVAVVPTGSLEHDLVLDFLPEYHQGSLSIAPLDNRRVTALFYANRAVELLDGGAPGEALDQARQSIGVDSGLGIGWNILGVIQQNQGMKAEAEFSFKKAMALDPEDGAPCGNLESLYHSEGREAEAKVFRDLGLKVRNRDPFFNAFLSEEALGEGHLEEADQRIRQAIRLLPYQSEFYAMKARVDLAQGEKSDAIKSLEKARKWSQPEMRARFDTKLALLRGEQPGQ